MVNGKLLLVFVGGVKSLVEVCYKMFGVMVIMLVFDCAQVLTTGYFCYCFIVSLIT